MRNCFLLLLYPVLNLSCFIISSTIASQNNDTDCLALLRFKEKITQDPYGVLNSWNNSISYCQWTGVQCSKRHIHRVISLQLRSYGLKGSLSPYIGNLTFLRTITLQNNSFHGEIPSEIGGLFRLRYIELSNNSFEGQLPKNLTKLVDLWYLNFIDNKITRKIPSELGSLFKLTHLGLSFNFLTGSIPTFLGNLSSLVVLSLARNNLVGNIPESLGKTQNLKFLQFVENRLTSTIPSTFYNISSLEYLFLFKNQLEGSLSQDMGNDFPRLIILDLSENKFTGRLPLSISNVSNLEGIYLFRNNFTGPVPRDLSKLKNLQVINIHSNNIGTTKGNDLDFIDSLTNNTQLKFIGASNNLLNGPLVNSLANLSTQLNTLSLGKNHIYGSIPSGIGKLVNLGWLEITFNNNIVGIIPDEIGKLQRLQKFYFIGNKLSGTIPPSFGNLTLLNFLGLHGNNLTGQMPIEISKLQNLLWLSLSENNLHGLVPKELMGISSLSIGLDFSHNVLTGSLPSEVGKLINLEQLDLSNNNLSGQIPKSLGSCVKLRYIDLNKNLFNGEVPQSLTSLRGLENFDLSHNNLSGRIPTFFGEITLLTNLNLSYNQLSGEVPTVGIYRNASIISVSGNDKLCGGIPELDLTACVTTSSDNGMPRGVKIGIAFTTTILCLTAVVIIVVLCLKRKSRKKLLHPSQESILLRNQFERISYSDIQKATEGFSESNLIGSGSFGFVYKGTLHPDGLVVAIKVLNLHQKGASKSFIYECTALRNIWHRNLVKVLSACSSVDFQGNDFKALVFEYMPNGNLHEWLHSKDNGKFLTLLQRLNLAIEVAKALEYLHHENDSIIVHSDLKPSNILLDGDMTAHVGDFGLAKIVSFDVPVAEGNQTTSSTIPLKGSIGYIPPEYGTSGNVTRQGDVYSYGIVLLEMFTGRRPTDTMFTNGLTLHDFVHRGLTEQNPEMFDPCLVAEADGRGSRRNVIESCCFSVLRIGIKCSMELANERMDIEEVVNEMGLISNLYLKQMRSNVGHH